MDKALVQIKQNLESVKKISSDKSKIEFWHARDLMPILGYSTWRQFSEAIERAKESCRASGQTIENHFLPAPAKSTGGRPKEDYFLTRYACYLIAQNGDSRKPQIALAQAYFATQTRRQELVEHREYESKRLEARAKLKETEKKIESTVYKRGIRLPVEFANFKNKHIKALYGGITASQLKKMRKIPVGRSLADFDTHVELKAKDFTLAMAEHNIRDKDIRSKDEINAEVIRNSLATRQTLISRGILPEKLKPEEDLKLIEARRKKEEKELEERKQTLLERQSNLEE